MDQAPTQNLTAQEWDFLADHSGWRLFGPLVLYRPWILVDQRAQREADREATEARLVRARPIQP